MWSSAQCYVLYVPKVQPCQSVCVLTLHGGMLCLNIITSVQGIWSSLQINRHIGALQFHKPSRRTEEDLKEEWQSEQCLPYVIADVMNRLSVLGEGKNVCAHFFDKDLTLLTMFYKSCFSSQTLKDKFIQKWKFSIHLYEIRGICWTLIYEPLNFVRAIF